jgi:uncharacterized protein
MSPPARNPSIFSRVLAAAGSLPARGLLGLIWIYRRTLSPVLPVVLGPACGCRFHPTCAEYAAQAVRAHGVLAGGWLALRRVLKCQPLHPGGFDPVPPSPWRRHAASPGRPVVRCVRVWPPATAPAMADPNSHEFGCIADSNPDEVGCVR